MHLNESTLDETENLEDNLESPTSKPLPIGGVKISNSSNKQNKVLMEINNKVDYKDFESKMYSKTN